ncbi:MAG: tRNA (adenosine(37)-N6)-threonylcarbamoyltransferase complex ATPase subunit type 1 TsaE [Oceanihabitans sp.]
MSFKLEYNLSEIDQVAKTILEKCKSKVVLFHGDLGAGKTTLIKALVKALGSEDVVQSPTYAIVNEYQAKENAIFHFDLYRINHIDEVYAFGIEEYLYSNHWVFIEWPEIIKDLIPDNYHIITITKKTAQTRLLELI